MVFCFRLLVVGSDVFQQKNMVIFLCGLETRLFYDTIYLEGIIKNEPNARFLLTTEMIRPPHTRSQPLCDGGVDFLSFIPYILLSSSSYGIIASKNAHAMGAARMFGNNVHTRLFKKEMQF